MSFVTDNPTKRILVVDDVADNVLLVQFILEIQGYKVDTADNGKAALAFLKTEVTKPDLIVLDLMMPVMNGYEVIHHLRNNRELARICVLLVTANTDVSLERAKQAGADDVLYKPLDIEQFLIRIELLNPADWQAR